MAQPGTQPFDYAAEFGSHYHAGRRLSNLGEDWVARIRASKVARFVRAADRVLEYGVGFGWNLAAVQCAEKVGFDVTPGLRGAVESKGIRFESSSASIPKGYFDVVICHHVLEHLRNPAACLVQLGAFLRNEGRLVLFVPFEKERKYCRFRSEDKAHHVFSWTPGSLRRLVVAAGFKVTSEGLQEFRFDRFAAIVAQRLKGGFGTYRRVRSIGLTLAPEYEIALAAECGGKK